MGRRKIEIKAIKDDRNRSVTFLKRKGGLFKKAHELSVLCSVDVAVIIFGHNKKLYEFSSGDINETIGRYQYYGQPHEHKGPADFRSKSGGDDDDDDDDDMSPPREESMPPQQHPQMMPPHIQHQPPFGHLRQPMPSASPPTQNGLFAGHGSPQPQMASRPSSRDTVRRSSSGLVPMQHPRAATPQPPQNGFAYMPGQPIYDSRPPPNLNPPPTAPPQFPHFPHHTPPQQLQHHPPLPPQQHPQHGPVQQLHQPFMHDQRRQSMPPAMPQPERPQPTPPIPHQQLPPRSPPQPATQQSLRPPETQSPPQPKHLSSKSRSIFTPIDASGSVLASHFFGRSPDPPRSEIKEEDSPELKPRPRNQRQPARSSTNPIRSSTVSSDSTVPSSRTNTISSMRSAPAARPRLTVQIPSEASDGEPGTADEASPAGTNQNSSGVRATVTATASTSTPNNRNRSDSHHSSGVVLPPPSPSASALLSAGASGPPNPFARPHPPTSTSNQQSNCNAYADNRNNNIDTPISALPSRFVAENLLPSPSSFYPDWGFGGRSGGHDSNMLPSPLTFPTPVVQVGAPQGWGRRDTSDMGIGGAGGSGAGEKRKGSEIGGGGSGGGVERGGGGGEGSQAKKLKT